MKKFIIVFIVIVGPPVVATFIQRNLSSPDTFRTLGMRGSLGVKRIADIQVSAWSKISAMAATSYQKARL